MIYQRADASKPFMGLKTFRGEMPVLSDVKVAKNYLDENELKILNNLVSGYFDFAEVQAMRHNPMHMADYIEHLDKVLSTTGERQLNGAGSVTHQQAMEKQKRVSKVPSRNAFPGGKGVFENHTGNRKGCQEKSKKINSDLWGWK